MPQIKIVPTAAALIAIMAIKQTRGIPLSFANWVTDSLSHATAAVILGVGFTYAEMHILEKFCAKRSPRSDSIDDNIISVAALINNPPVIAVLYAKPLHYLLSKQLGLRNENQSQILFNLLVVGLFVGFATGVNYSLEKFMEWSTRRNNTVGTAESHDILLRRIRRVNTAGTAESHDSLLRRIRRVNTAGTARLLLGQNTIFSSAQNVVDTPPPYDAPPPYTERDLSRRYIS